MALVSCPECGREVSDQASSCPQCGMPINKTNEKDVNHNKNVNNTDGNKKIIKAIAGVGLIIVGITCCLTDNVLPGLAFFAASIFSFIEANKQ